MQSLCLEFLLFIVFSLFPESISGQSYSQEGPKLVGPTTKSSQPSHQGNSVALSGTGDILISGGFSDGNVGCVWIFNRNQTNNGFFQPEEKLTSFNNNGTNNGTLPTNTSQGSPLYGPSFGRSVAMSSAGTLLAIGGPTDNYSLGAVWIFIRNETNYTYRPQAKVIGSDWIGEHENFHGIYQGTSVALSSLGDILAVGGPGDNYGIGCVWIFLWNGTLWLQSGNKLVGSGFIGNSSQGSSLALSSKGDILAIGGNQDDDNLGATWIFTSINGIWKQQGLKLVGTGALGASAQGSSLSLTSLGDLLVIGGSSDDNNTGAIWIFSDHNNNGSWLQVGNKRVGSDGIGPSCQGSSVDMSDNGDTIAVGGSCDNNSTGRVWIWKRNDTLTSINYIQLESKVGSGNENRDLIGGQGSAVALSSNGKFLASGSPGDNHSTGAVWMFASEDSSPSSNLSFAIILYLVVLITTFCIGMICSCYCYKQKYVHRKQIDSLPLIPPGSTQDDY